jgi:Fur family transcriptional regulator, ferric uptake regulator
MSNTRNIEQILVGHHVRRTKVRVAVLDIFMQRNHALAHSEIEHVIGGAFDRVTLYRTLKSFEEQGLIHRVIDDSGSMKYALCHGACAEHAHHDQHIHFSCLKCGHTFCLDAVPIPAFQLPPEYEFQKIDLLAQGICKDCR